jgi:signal transduction histidine kinase
VIRRRRRLRDALARALGDPSLALAYWLGEFESWADVDGNAIELPSEGSGRSTTLIEREETHIAALIHDPSLDDEPDLLHAVASAAAIGLENARLQIELRARVDELRGSRARLVEAADAERRRLERNLHDGAQQRMVSVALQLRLAQGRIGNDPAVAEQLLTTASDELALSLSELRELARGIHPAVLEHLGLGLRQGHPRRRRLPPAAARRRPRADRRFRPVGRRRDDAADRGRYEGHRGGRLRGRGRAHHG